MTQDDFITKAKSIHGNRYDYSLVEYKGSRINVNIICPIHGVFTQLPIVHTHQKSGCPKCYYGETQESFISRSNKIHNNLYDYSLTNYINNRVKVNIICSIHGVFEQSPNKHLAGHKCPKCQNKYQTTSEFIQKAKITHGTRYDYSKSTYVNSETKLIIICKKHGEFLQLPRSHINGRGCPNCLQSQGENKISTWLENKNINFIPQKKFDGCKYKNKLPFDFYLPNYNICIEFDGEQHVNGWHLSKNKEKDLELIKIKDEIKNIYCISNNIRLIRIPYNLINDIPIILELALSGVSHTI